MPSWPPGVELANLIFGKGITPDGEQTGAELVLRLRISGTGAIVWASDGTPVYPFERRKTADAGGYGSIAVPVVNQDGWLDGSQNLYKSWYYEVIETPIFGDLRGDPRQKSWQPLSGVGSQDFDRIPDGSAGLPVVTPQQWATVAQLAALQPSLTRTSVKTAAYTAAPAQLIPVDATAGAVPITLPTAPPDKTRVLVKKIDSSSNAVSLLTGTGDVFNRAGGVTSVSLPLFGQAVAVQYDAGTAIWTIVSDDLPLGQLDLRFTGATAPVGGFLSGALPNPGVNQTALSNAMAARTPIYWQPNTFYALGQQVWAPDGSLVQAIASFTSGATYNAANWSVIVASAASNSATYSPILTPVSTYTWNADGTIASQTIGGVTTMFTWNSDGTLATETRAGVTRTYSYSGGTLAAVA